MPSDSPNNEPDEDSQLVERAKHGDTRAFDALILKYGDRLFGLVYNMTRHKDDTYDLLQDIFAKAYHSLSSFKGNASFHTWLHQIAVNQTLNFIKKRNRRSGPSLDDEGNLLENHDALVDQSQIANPEKSARTKDLQIKLNKALSQLSESHRTVVVMHDVQGMSHGEIAVILKVSEGTVRSRLHYAHLQLQSLLQDAWSERF